VGGRVGREGKCGSGGGVGRREIWGGEGSGRSIRHVLAVGWGEECALKCSSSSGEVSCSGRRTSEGPWFFRLKKG